MSNIANNFLSESLTIDKPQYREDVDVEPTESLEYGLGTKDLWTRSMNNDSVIAIAMGAAERMSDSVDFDIDPEFKFDDAFKAAKEMDNSINIHPDFLQDFKDKAKNQSHFESMIGYYKEESAKQRYLEDQGFWTQFGITAVAELTNAPLYIGAAALLPSTAALASSTALARFATSGAAGAAIEGIKDVVGEQDKDKWDYAAAVLIDGSLGAILGKGVDPFKNELNKKVLHELGIDKDKLEEIQKATTKEEKRTIAQEAYTTKTNLPADETVTAALDEQIKQATTSNAVKMWQTLRQDIAYVTGKSESDTFALFSGKAFSDATLQSVNLSNLDMVTARDLLEETMRAKMQTLFEPLLRKWVFMSHQGLTLSKLKATSEDRRLFSEMLGQIQLRKRAYNESAEEIIDNVFSAKGELRELLIEASKKMDEYSLYTHKKLKEAGHPDFKEGGILPNANYMPYNYSKNLIASLEAKGITKPQIIDFFKNAINSKTADLSEEQAKLLAETFYTLIGKSELGRLNTFNSVLDDIIDSGNYRDELVEIAKDVKLKAAGSEKDIVGSMNELSPVDHAYRQEFQIGSEKMDIGVIDFMEKDYLNVMDMYARRMSGTTQLAKFEWTYKNADQTEDVLNLKTGETSQKISEKTLNTINAKIRNNPFIKKLEADLSALKSKFNLDNDYYRLFDTTIRQVTKNLDGRTKLARDINKAVNDGDLNAAAKLIYDELEANAAKFEGVDLARFYELATRSRADYQKGISDLEAKIKLEKKNLFDKETATKVDGAKRTLRTKEDIEDFTEQVRRELSQKVKDGKIDETEAFKEQVRFKTILKDLMGEPTAKDPLGRLNQVWGITNSITIGRLLGSVFWSMPAEIVRVSYDQGIRNIVESFPVIKELLKSYSSGKFNNAALQELNESLGFFNDFFSGPRTFGYSHEYSALSPKATKIMDKSIEKGKVFSENFSEFTAMMGGMKPIQAWLQAAHAMGVFKKMKKVANGGKETSNYKKMIKELGLSDDAAKKIYDQIKTHSDDVKMNFDNWDTNIKNIFLHGIKRRSDTIVQVNRLGDKPAWVVGQNEYMLNDTIIGKIVMHLKSFMLTAYVKQLGHAVGRADLYTAGLIMSQSLALVFATMAKNQFNYAGDEKKLREKMQPERVIMDAMAYLPQTSIIPGAIDVISQLLMQEPVFGQTRHQDIATNAFASLPAVDLTIRTLSLLSIPSKLSDGVEAKDFSDVASLLGISNSWLTRTLWHNMSRDTVFDQPKIKDREFKPDYRMSP